MNFLSQLQDVFFVDVVVKSDGSWEEITFIVHVQAGHTVINAAVWVMVHISATHGCTQQVKGVGHGVAKQLAACFVVRSNHKDALIPWMDCDLLGLVH